MSHDDFQPFDVEIEDDPDKAFVADCGDANCCMNFAPHYRHECYTPEMYEAMIAEAQRETATTGTAAANDNERGKTP